MGDVYPNPVAYLPEEISPGYCILVTAEPDLIVCESFGLYVPLNPEKTVLYQVVAGNLETFLARQRNRDRVVSGFVEQALPDRAQSLCAEWRQPEDGHQPFKHRKPEKMAGSGLVDVSHFVRIWGTAGIGALPGESGSLGFLCAVSRKVDRMPFG